MAEHYTKTTTEAKLFCPHCRSYTMHHVMGGRKAGCQACIAKEEAKPKQAPPAVQEGLFK